MERIENKDTCACGGVLNFKATPFMSSETAVCRHCGAKLNVDVALTDWRAIAAKRIAKGGEA